MDDHDDRDGLDWLRAALPDPAPQDVVPPRPLDRATVLSLRAMAGREVTLTIPGRPIYGADGALIGMTAPTRTTGTLGQFRITQAEADRLDLPTE